MSAADSKPVRRPWYWLTVVALIVGASRALLKYLWWAAMYSALHGIPKEARRFREADAHATFNWWLLVGLGGTAIVVAAILIPPFQSQTLPSSVNTISRVVFASVLVVGLICVVAVVTSATGY